MTFRIETNVTGPTYYLRGTTWTSELARASTFTTEGNAQAAIDKARKFNPKAVRAARIVPHTTKSEAD